MANIVDETNRDLWNGMKNAPDKLLRLIRAIQQIHEWNQRHGYKTNDNFDKIKKKYLEEMERHNREIEKLNKQAEKDFRKIYRDYSAMHDLDTNIEALQQNPQEIETPPLPGNLQGIEAMLPESFNPLKQQVIYIIVHDNEKQKQHEQIMKKVKAGKYRNNPEKLENDIKANEWNEEKVAKAIEEDWRANGTSETTTKGWQEISKNDDFEVVMDEYAEQYEDLFMDDYRTEKGGYDFFTLDQETEITEDIIKPVSCEIVQDKDIKKAIEETNKERREEITTAVQTYEQERKNYLNNEDMEL